MNYYKNSPWDCELQNQGLKGLLFCDLDVAR